MPDSPLVVVKVGGSLLTLPDLSARPQSVLDSRPGLRPLLVAGGGTLVDVVRGWEAAFALGDAVCHELALEAMNTTASLLAHLVPRGRTIETPFAADACWSRREIPVLRVKPWLEDACAGDALPKSWNVTSDSLAAWVAASWRADELWLLKSVDLPETMTLDEANAAGLVDLHFPRLARQAPVIRWCNLRRNGPALTWVTFPT